MKKLLSYAIIAVMLFSASTVEAKKKTLLVITHNESLAALTKITDMTHSCMNPWGGDYGKDLYFTVFEDNKYYNIYKKDDVLSNAVITKTSGKNRHTTPVCCKAIDRVAFRYWGEESTNSDIYMIAASKGKALIQVTDTQDGNEGNPNLSKDGQWMIYDKRPLSFNKVTVLNAEQFVFSLQHSELWLKNLSTGETILLGSGSQPVLSPDGKKIAFIKFAADVKSSSLWVMNLDGSETRQITDASKGYAAAPQWSPDGTKLIFQLSRKDKKDADIYVIDENGDNLIQYTNNKSADITPYWTEDNFVYFSSDRGSVPGHYQIWRFKVE